MAMKAPVPTVPGPIRVPRALARYDPPVSRREEHEEKELLERLVEQGDVQIAWLEDIDHLLTLILQLLKPPSATTAVLSIEGASMPLTVGGTETVTLTFVDATGAPAAPPTGDGSGLVVTIDSDNGAVATVGPVTSSGDTATATSTGVSAGSYNLIGNVANTSGAALVDDDGTTAFVQPAALADSVTAPPPAQAVTAVLSVS
jgi:hypothetical protein